MPKERSLGSTKKSLPDDKKPFDVRATLDGEAADRQQKEAHRTRGKEIIQSGKEALGRGWEGVKGLFSKTKDWAGKQVQNVGREISRLGESAFDGIAEFVGKGAHNLDQAQESYSDTKRKASEGWNAVGEAGKNIKTQLSEGVEGEAWKATLKLMEGFNSIRDNARGFGEAVSNIKTQVVDGLNLEKSKIGAKLTKFAEDYGPAVKKTGKAVGKGAMIAGAIVGSPILAPAAAMYGAYKGGKKAKNWYERTDIKQGARDALKLVTETLGKFRPWAAEKAINAQTKFDTTLASAKNVLTGNRNKEMFEALHVKLDQLHIAYKESDKRHDEKHTQAREELEARETALAMLMQDKKTFLELAKAGDLLKVTRELAKEIMEQARLARVHLETTNDESLTEIEVPEAA